MRKTLVEQVSQDWGNRTLKSTQVLRAAATATLRSVNTPDRTRISLRMARLWGELKQQELKRQERRDEAPEER